MTENREPPSFRWLTGDDIREDSDIDANDVDATDEPEPKHPPVKGKWDGMPTGGFRSQAYIERELARRKGYLD